MIPAVSEHPRWFAIAASLPEEAALTFPLTEKASSATIDFYASALAFDLLGVFPARAYAFRIRGGARHPELVIRHLKDHPLPPAPSAANWTAAASPPVPFYSGAS